MKGQCLCAAVEFELDTPVPNLYQCHCSLCRRVSGSASNSALIIPAAQFHWIKGAQSISHFENSSGFKSDFCASCGSPLPNLTREDQCYWVPVGLLDDSEQLSIAAHLYIGSKARWDSPAASGEHFDEMPDAKILTQLLSSE